MPSVEKLVLTSVEDSVSVESNTQCSLSDKHFDLLCDQYYHSWLRYHPESAVSVGVNEYAEILKSYEHDDIGALIVLNQKMQSAMDELTLAELSEARQIDYRVLSGAISVELHDLEENDWRYRNPVEYLPINAIYQLLIHPGSNVHKATKHRLQAIPEYLRGAKSMLSHYPERVVPEWTVTAIGIARSGAEFIHTLDRNPLLTAKFTNPARLQPLFDEAAHAINDFADYLENDVLPSAAGKFASGHNRFNRLINEKHFLSADAAKILDFGERLVAQTEEELLRYSDKICGEQNINKALAKVGAKHPAATQLLDSYRKRMQTAHAWLLKADIVTVPEQQSLKVQQTPKFLRGIIPFAAYEPPMPHDKKQRGLYYVTTVEDEALLAEHNQFSIDLISAHEAFPGHHLQFVIANQNHKKNMTRLLNASASMYEGWALYCEQLVFEQGLYNQKEHAFILLRDRLWRALRIVIDVKIHTGQFTFDDAVNLLVEKLGFDVSQAQAEVSWYCNAAATPLCYAIGRELILKTREIIVGEQISVADKVKLKAFHDAILSQGSIALPLVIKSVFGESVWQQVHDAVFAD
ncbi:MAG: hypothetical protein COB77_00845 [Gammaproteobacteria bacterium]|nr:MAG: hypothetical protein COB77_00845 [Gammaproteobacteria bacterium]